jgi:arylformamidase
LEISIEITGKQHGIDTGYPLDLSIPLVFNGDQPNAYGVEKASSKACEAGDLVGDTRRGGSCNFEQYTFIPHCNGTHTECIGHITNERISIRDCFQDVFIPAKLISVAPERAGETSDAHAVECEDGDLLITRKCIENAVLNHPLPQVVPTSLVALPTALIVRTRPNDDSKLTRTYLEQVPPFFSTEAMEYIVEIGIRHLLVDMPSIDRIYDEGQLSNHRIFWNVEPGSFELNEDSRVNNTITELIYVPNEVEDGEYLLNLQIAPFASDATPSRPVIFKIIE